MKLSRTIKLKIPKNQACVDMMKKYRNAVSYIANEGYKHRVFNKYDLHHLCYYRVKEKFKLPSQFIINANALASRTLKSIKSKNKLMKCPKFKEILPLDFDRRTFSFAFNKIRITTTNGRMDIPIEIPKYYWKYLDWTPQTAQIIFERGQWFINICLARDHERNIETLTRRTIGVDIGINTIAVTSRKQFFNSRQVKKKKLIFKRLRARLQAKGTKSARELLRKISGREKRFMAWVNHNISKKIIDALEAGDTIILEDIKRSRIKNKGRKMNFWLQSWTFYELQRFITYKAMVRGINVRKVSPFFTSQICSKCEHIGSRFKSFFRCLHCRYSLHADLNASYNLAKRGSMSDCVLAVVNQPNISCDDSKASIEAQEEQRDNINHGL